jgi:hypothetical protein
MSDDIGTALLLAIGAGGVVMFASKMDTDKKIKEATKQVSNHSHALVSHDHPSLETRMDTHLATENLTDETFGQRYYARMFENRNQDPYGRLVVGHPKGVWDERLRMQSKSEGMVPAYRISANSSTSLPAMIDDGTQSDYFHDLRSINDGRVISPNYSMPKYHHFTNNRFVANSHYRGEWITMVDLTRALEALNGKVEEYRNKMYADMREWMWP